MARRAIPIGSFFPDYAMARIGSALAIEFLDQDGDASSDAETLVRPIIRFSPLNLLCL
jgi:hypothetical protein